MQGRLINISRVLILNNINDSTFMDMISLCIYIKAKIGTSRLFFKNQKDLLRQLHIGHSRFCKIKKHKLFNDFIRLEDNFIVAKKRKYNKIQLTFGIGNHVKIKETRPIIELDENKIHDIDYIQDQIKVALFNNEVIVLRNRLHGGEMYSCSSDKKEGCRLLEVLKQCTFSYKAIASKLGCGTTKAKYIVDQAISQNLVVKKINIISASWSKDPGYANYVKECWDSLPEGKKVGAAWESNGIFFWQIGNSYTTVNKESANRWYYGQREIELNHPEEYSDIKKEYDLYAKKMDGNMVNDLFNFIGIDEITDPSNITTITNNEGHSDELIKIEIKRYLERVYPGWGDLDSKRRNAEIRKYFKAHKKETKNKYLNNYYRGILAGHNRYNKMDESTKLYANEATEKWLDACAKAGVLPKTISGAVRAHQKKEARMGNRVGFEDAIMSVYLKKIDEGKQEYAEAVSKMSYLTETVMAERIYNDLLMKGVNIEAEVNNVRIEDLIKGRRSENMEGLFSHSS